MQTTTKPLRVFLHNKVESEIATITKILGDCELFGHILQLGQKHTYGAPL